MPKGLYIKNKVTGVWYMRFQQDGIRVHESTGETSLAAAKERLQDKRTRMFQEAQDAALNSMYEGDDMTFRKASQLAYEEYFAQHRGAYETSKKLGVINECIGDELVSQIDHTTFAKVARMLRQRGCGNNTINKYSSTINKTLETVQKSYNAPCRSFTKVTLAYSRTTIRDISHREEEKIIAWLKTSAFQRQPRAGWTPQDLIEIYRIGTMTGMRRGEIFSFRVEQIKGQTIILDPEQHKTGQKSGTKTIILSKAAVGLLEKRIARHNLKPNQPVFGYSKDAFTKLWQRMKSGIGLEHDRRFTPHCMRHTFASRMAEQKVPIYHVSKMLGHTSVKTTEMYAHMFADELIATMNNIGQ